MKKLIIFLQLILSTFIFSQEISLNQKFIENYLRFNQLIDSSKSIYSFNIRPIINDDKNNYTILKNFKKNILNKSWLKVDLYPIEYIFDYNSHHPYNRNNGTMIPNKGYQHILSGGFKLKSGPLVIKIRPEHHFAENKKFPGFWEGHYPEIWAERYKLWNKIDMPERFGNEKHNRVLIGQSSIKFNFKNLSIGISNENIWWGPGIRNSIMMSNHAEGFEHISFSNIQPLKTLIGNFEWQFITGKLESSGFTPPRTDFEYQGNKLYVEKINQRGKTDDWRYLQALIVSYSPKWIDGLSLGFIRWVQMYSDLVKGNYTWLEGSPTYFPVFKNLFRKNDQFENYEAQTNQAGGVFFRWIWKESNAEIYSEFHYNDSKHNLRDLLLDTDHSRAMTLGLQKVFNDNLLVSWEWTQMEQNASRLVRNAGYWYEHGWVYDGYTNNGEVLGSSIGPGSNSNYLSIKKYSEDNMYGIALEIVDNDNDFYHNAFASARDSRRYWKDYNLHLNYFKKFKKFMLNINLVYNRSLNYQWELDDTATPYYHPGKDVNNFHTTINFLYFFN